MPHKKKRSSAGKRVRPSGSTWLAVLKRAEYSCEWNEGGSICGLKDGDIDPIGGGRVRLTPDHKSPHSLRPDTNSKDPEQWQALCGRHQVTKKNYWDSSTGKLNTYAIVQFAPKSEKKRVFKFLLSYFGYTMAKDRNIRKKCK